MKKVIMQWLLTYIKQYFHIKDLFFKFIDCGKTLKNNNKKKKKNCSVP